MNNNLLYIKDEIKKDTAIVIEKAKRKILMVFIK